MKGKRLADYLQKAKQLGRCTYEFTYTDVYMKRQQKHSRAPADAVKVAEAPGTVRGDGSHICARHFC